MIETEIKLIINRKSDIDIVRRNIIETNIQFPVYIFESENHYQIEFVSSYEEWELDSKILLSFPDCEFTKDLEKGRKEIRLQLTRYQSENSTDIWGRQIENPLNETKYLIKKSDKASHNFEPQVKVLFEGSEQNYFINIVNGINKSTGEKGFLLFGDFKTNNEKGDAELLRDTLYKTANEAFRFGYYKMQENVNEDFKKYIQEKKKKITELYKAPRKIVRDFVTACNKYEINETIKSLDTNVIFEKTVQWQLKLHTKGIQQFKEYLNSSDQDLCSNNFKIRSSWNIQLPNIKIGVKFPPHNLNPEKNDTISLKYRQFTFTIDNDKIIRIIEDQ